MKVYIATFGCRANHYDSEAARAMLEAGGAQMVDAPEEADVALFNSCAVTSRAEADLRSGIRRAARANPRLRTVVMGCASALDARRDPARSLRVLPAVGSVVAGADLDGVARALGLDPALALRRRAHQSGARALLRIQDGCDEHCTFCATTQARGVNRSRPVAELLEEAGRLAEWHAEIVLTGVHIGSYGADLGGGASLSVLVERLVTEVPRARFRLSSVEATEVDDRLRELLVAGDSGLVPYLHAPLQSGSDRVLRRMGRHWYSASTYATAVERIVRDGSVFGLGADVIAGFPGERDEDHRATMAMVESLPFTGLHVFPYSLRPGTAAERLGERVHGEEVSRRASELRALAARKARDYESQRIGGRADVIVIGGARGAGWSGLTEDYLAVTIPDRGIARGSRVDALLEARDGALFARPLQP